MVEVLVHSFAPLLGSELAEEAVGFAGTCGWASAMETVDEGDEPEALGVKFGSVAYPQIRCGGVASAPWLVIGVDGLEERADEASDQDLRDISFSERHLHGGGAVGDHLGRVHFSPEARRGGAERRQSPIHFFYGCGIV